MFESIGVIGLGETAHRGKLQSYLIGVNDSGRFHSLDELVILDYPRVFTTERLKGIIQTKCKVINTHIPEWGQYFQDVNIIELSPARYSLEEIDGPRYPHSSDSPFVATIRAYRLGAKQIILHGVDYNNHPTLSREQKLNRVLKTYSELRAVLLVRGVELFVGSSGSRLSSVLPVWG